MSCLLDEILDVETQNSIDDGINFISEKITSAKKTFNTSELKEEKKPNSFKDCTSNKLNRTALWANIVLQILSLIVLGVIAKTNKKNQWSINALTWISWITLILLVVQYKDALMSGFKLFMYGVSKKTQLITVLSLLIVLLTNLLHAKEGSTVNIVAMSIFVLIFTRVWLQIKTTLDTESSMVSVFLDFINRLITKKRIDKVKNAFD